MKLRDLIPFRSKAAAPAALPSMVMPSWGSRWHHLFGGDREPGSWQRGLEVPHDDALRHPAVYGCVTQIAGDIGKLRPCLKQLSGVGGYWSEMTSPAFSPVLGSPNYYQSPQQFLETWLLSKLIHGNTYALKVRDNRNVVIGLWIIDPLRVLPLVTTDGTSQVFYQLQHDNMVPGLDAGSVVVPAREIIHDRNMPIWHPLIGMPPLYAAHIAVATGLAIGASVSRFFRRGVQLSGVLTAPGQIDPDTAKRLEESWDQDMAGDRNAGKIAVLGSNLKFESMQASLVDSQVAELAKLSSTDVCTAYGVPPWKVGLDVALRGIINTQSLQILYLEGCLQRHITGVEQALTVGLNLPAGMKVALDETELLRLDSISLGEYLGGLVQKGILSPNEARAKMGFGPIAGGENAFLQQQNWPLQALASPDRGPATASGAAVEPPPPDTGSKRIRERVVATRYDAEGRIAEIEKEIIGYE